MTSTPSPAAFQPVPLDGNLLRSVAKWRTALWSSDALFAADMDVSPDVLSDLEGGGDVRVSHVQEYFRRMGWELVFLVDGVRFPPLGLTDDLSLLPPSYGGPVNRLADPLEVSRDIHSAVRVEVFRALPMLRPEGSLNPRLSDIAEGEAATGRALRVILRPTAEGPLLLKTQRAVALVAHNATDPDPELHPELYAGAPAYLLKAPRPSTASDVASGPTASPR